MAVSFFLTYESNALIMSSKRQILASLSAMAKKLGRTPSLMEFSIRTRTPRKLAFRYFRKWNEAVRAAGLPPCRQYKRLEDTALLKDWGEAVRKARGLPSRAAYQRVGSHSPRTLEARFGNWRAVGRAFKRFAKNRPEWDDVVAILSNCKSKANRSLMAGNGPVYDSAEHVPLAKRSTYGNPIDFRGLRHEPVNEQGVVLLFGMVAQELGYLIESVQNGFPDCEAKRQVGSGRWQRVLIEFEFESRNFRDHGHPTTGCDLIVCWRHNWPDCPAHLEVVELSGFVKSDAYSKGQNYRVSI